jgi:long-subunit acyl-CoA synthetase (AMP-forming)
MGNTPSSALDPFYAALRRQAEYRPHAVAVAERIVAKGYKETSWKELFELARGFSYLPPSQPIVPMLVGRSARCVAAMVGLMQSGRAFSCLNPKLRTPHIINILDRLDAKIALIDGNGLKMIRDGIETDDRIALTTWIVIDDDLKKPAQRLLAKLQDRAEVIVWESPTTLEPNRNAGDGHLAGCVFPSGSTGVPKGVLLGKADLHRRSEIEIEKFYLTEQDHLLSILPFCFDVGINQTMATLLSGCEMVIVDSWLPKDIMRAVAERGITGIPGTPSVWQDFINTQSAFDRNGEHAS